MTLVAGRIEPDGTLTSGSMARSIERALEGLAPLGANENPVARRKLALAVSLGVIDHLRDRLGSLRFVMLDEDGSGTHVERPFDDVDLGGWT